MKRVHRSRTLQATLLPVSIALLSVTTARAEITLYDKDGWTLEHDGLAQGFYVLSMGDAVVKGGSAPPAAVGWGGWDNPGADADGDFMSSRFRSGWTGSRFNWTATRTVSEETSVSAVLGVAFAISTDNSPTRTANAWDVRNAFIKIENKSWGELYIGRHVGLYTLGSIISTINSTSAALGIGNGCATGGDGLACYTSGYGVKFPGFWAGVQYQTPDLSGLRIKLALLDPVAAGADAPTISVPYTRRPLPMLQALVRYEGDFGSFKLIPYFNGFMQQVGQVGSSETLTPWGAGGGLEVHIAGLRAGAGGTFESGTGFYGPLYTSASVIDGAGELREGNSFFAHALYSFGGVIDISAGYGQANTNRTANDEANDLNVQEMQSNVHAAVQYHYYPFLTFLAEVNLLSHEWVEGNSQDVQLINIGASFTY